MGLPAINKMPRQRPGGSVAPAACIHPLASLLHPARSCTPSPDERGPSLLRNNKLLTTPRTTCLPPADAGRVVGNAPRDSDSGLGTCHPGHSGAFGRTRHLPHCFAGKRDDMYQYGQHLSYPSPQKGVPKMGSVVFVSCGPSFMHNSNQAPPPKYARGNDTRLVAAAYDCHSRLHVFFPAL